MPDPNFIPSNDIPGKLRVPAQVVLDAKLKVASKEVLMDLGEQDNLAYTYYRGLVVKTDDLLEYWEWREPVDITEVGLLPSGYLYPDGLIVDGIDYSNATYNFFPFLQKLPSFAKVVYFNDVDPSIATIFDTANPPITNDDTLKNDVDNLYVGNNASTWVYKTSPAGYITYNSTSSGSNFTITGTNTDAGSIKTGSITKHGELVIDSDVPDVSGLVLKQIPNNPNTILSPFVPSITTPKQMVQRADGNFYVALDSANKISKVTPAGVYTDFSTGIPSPRGICFANDGHFYVATLSGTIYKITTAGVATVFTTGAGNANCIIQATDGNFYIGTNSTPSSILKVTPSGVVTTFLSGYVNIFSICQGPDGLLYCGTTSPNAIIRITLGGVVSTFLNLDILPYSICFSSDGNFYIVGGALGEVRKITQLGVQTVVITGVGQQSYSIIEGVDKALYISSAGDNKISKILRSLKKVLTTDAQGKVIKSTYLEDIQYTKPADLLVKEDKFNKGIANGYTPLDSLGKVPLIHIDDSNFVHRTGNETIAGVKTFNNTLANLSRITAVTNIDATSSALITGSHSPKYGGVEIQALGSSSKGLIGLVGASGGDPAAIFLKSSLTGSGASYATMLLLDNITAGNDVTPIRVRKQGVEVAKLDYLGNFTANSFIKTGGTAVEYLMADGSVSLGTAPTPDATTLIKGIVQLAGDLGGTAASPTTPTAIHKTGDESGLTGIKSWTNTGTSQTNGLSLINNGTGLSASLRVVNASTGFAQYVDNQNSGGGIYMLNSGAGFGVWLEDSGTGRGIYINRTNTGTGLWINNSSTGRGIYLSNSSSGEGVKIDNGGTGTGITSNSLVASTGFLYTGQNNGTNTFTVNKTGDIVANKYTKTGGLATEYLRADGSVNTTVITGTLNTNRISKSIGVNSITDSQIRDDGTNVGIGGNASVKLEIFGSTKSDAFITNGGDSTHFIDGTGALQNKSQFQLALTNPVTGTGVIGQVSFFNGTTTQTGDNGLFWDNTNKRLGIGTTSPTSLLDLQHTTLPQIDLHTGVTKRADIRSSDATLFFNSITGNDIQFQTDSSTKVTITNGGNVGLGVPPTHKLHVKGSTYETSSIVVERDSGAIGKWGIGVQNLNNQFGIQDLAQGGLTRLVISPTGDVGIGTINPTYKVTIGSVAQEAQGYGFITPSSNWGVISSSLSFQSEDGLNANTNFTINLWRGTAGAGYGTTSTKLIVKSDGNVGIGTTSPTANLHIAASTTAKALMRLTVGPAPTTPNDGDVWLESNTNTGLKIRIAGVTKTISLI